jgi:single-strand DNA-binding protein
MGDGIVNGIVSCVTGRVGSDAEFKYSSNGHPLLAFSLAADDSKRAEGEPTEWLRVVVFGERAEELHRQIGKGARVYAEGRLRLEQWTGRDGDQRASLKLTAWIVQPMGLESRRPRQDDQPRRPNAMPEAVAVHGTRVTSRGSAGMVDRGDDPDRLPF